MTFFGYLGALLALGLAMGVLLRERRTGVAWSLVTAMMLTAAETAATARAYSVLYAEQMAFWQNVRLSVCAFLPGAWLWFGLTYGRGNPHDFLRRWRVALALAFALPWVFVIAFWGDLVQAAAPVVGPGEPEFQLSLGGVLARLIELVGLVLVLMNLERTYRAAVGTMRWQIKYMVIGAGLLLIVRVYTSSQAVLYRATSAPLDSVNGLGLTAACLLMARGLWRAGVFKVDVYPSRTVLHTSITVLLAGIYLLVVGLFAKLVSFLGGDAAFALKAFLILVALVLLTMLLLSDRVRERTRRLVSRHFRRPHHDYRRVWALFTEKTGGLLDEAQLSRAVVRWLAETFNVLSVTLWLVDENRRRLVFGGSTSLTDKTAAKLISSSSIETAGIVDALSGRSEPIDLETAQGSWVDTLRQCNPIFFPEGGGRTCVPIRSAGNLVGVLALGDRISGIPFSLEDLDLLKCIADQLAAHLNSIQLSRKLLQAKEMEAFQTMSTFFVHDLKNTAATLSLMVRNLPGHFDDPAFREDALRGLSKSVTRINELIGRLALLRQKLDMKFTPTDLNQVVESVLANLELAHHLRIQRNLQPVPAAQIDAEQFQKVVTNLLLNAKEALTDGGEIRVETGRQDSWITLTVADDGCGMSPEFLSQQLFRPFQTTKKKGIGIGMFHSKMIVEAHRGRFEVQSTLGKGTTFRVMLPGP